MIDQREIEAKFEAELETINVLIGLETFGRFRVHERKEKDQDDLYYDTAQGHLREAGASLRVRRGRDGSRMTFKGQRSPVGGQEHVVSRLEDEVDVDPGMLEQVGERDTLVLDPQPSPLARARLLTDADLLPTARLRTARTVLIASASGQDEVELAVDRCEAVRLSDGRRVEFVEVEIELKRGAPAALADAIDDLTQAVAGLRPSTRTKLERALG